MTVFAIGWLQQFLCGKDKVLVWRLHKMTTWLLTIEWSLESEGRKKRNTQHFCIFRGTECLKKVYFLKRLLHIWAYPEPIQKAYSDIWYIWNEGLRFPLHNFEMFKWSVVSTYFKKYFIGVLKMLILKLRCSKYFNNVALFWSPWGSVMS